MARRQPSRRAVLALAGGALFGGCVGRVDTGLGDDEVDDASWPGVGCDDRHTGYDPTTAVGDEAPDERWATALDGPLTTPTVVGDTVYLTRGAPTDGAPEATLEAFGVATGERRWSKSLDADFAFHAPNSDFRPVYHDETVYVNVNEGVTAVDAATRQVRWAVSYDGMFNDLPVATDDGVYLGGAVRVEDDNDPPHRGSKPGLVALSHDGEERWRATTDERMGRPHVPAATEDTVYVSFGHELAALDPADGSDRWRTEVGTRTTTPVVADDAILLASHGRVEAVGLGGTPRWLTKVDTLDAVTRPAVADGRVFVAGFRGTNLALDLAVRCPRRRRRRHPDRARP
jgi:outer membrane protein assembly factor BamB